MYVVCDKNKLVCKHTLRACEACTGPERGSAIVAGICPICPFAMPTDEGASDTTGMRQLAEGYQACAGRLMMHACWTLIERVELNYTMLLQRYIFSLLMTPGGIETGQVRDLTVGHKHPGIWLGCWDTLQSRSPSVQVHQFVICCRMW